MDLPGNACDLSSSHQVKAIIVIPSKDGIQSFQDVLDPGFRRGDDLACEFLLKSPALGLPGFLLIPT